MRCSALAAAIAGDRVPRTPEARIALDVHVQQIARARPLVAPELLAWRAAASASSRGGLQDRVHRRVRDVGLAGDQPRPPARAFARGAAPRVSIAGAVRRGDRRGRLERSRAHAPERAILGRWRSATGASTDARSQARPTSTQPPVVLASSSHRSTRPSLRRPAGPSRALACVMSGPSFCVSWRTHRASGAARTTTSRRSQPSWADQLVRGRAPETNIATATRAFTFPPWRG